MVRYVGFWGHVLPCHFFARVTVAGVLFAFFMQPLTVSTMNCFGGQVLPCHFFARVAGAFFASFMQLLTVSTMNRQTFAKPVCSFSLTLSIAIESLAFALAVGLVGRL
ncbi:hypothetical protein [uncultured Desulfuromonas sp.]|uniref:hypothetical protein n=1 Tax=uncultured Desulfuromonas sp. TaxID=181013 RepID=UPI00261B1007|nr:hypothetical protein [uncultured Desulfuromonas sp.]